MESDVTDSFISSQNSSGWFYWAYKGVDFDLAGNGGIECRDFLSFRQRIIESIIGSVCAGLIMYRALFRLTIPTSKESFNRPDPCGKRILLVIHCLIFGIELGFKFATKQMIYVLNPCHIATMMQIFCLAAPPSKLTTAVFRLHLHMLTGAPMAILFPVINTRLLPFETEVYYIQHILMLVIPFYLLRIGGVYTAEPLLDFSWASVSLGMLYIYHFLPLQYLAYVSLVNLNNMLCPAISDPFYGPLYRICAMTHQGLLIPTLGKFYTWLSKATGLRKCDLEVTEESVYYYIRQQQKALRQLEKDACGDHKDSVAPSLNGRNGVVKHPDHSRKPSNGHVKSS